jgi:hypothetical protein
MFTERRFRFIESIEEKGSSNELEGSGKRKTELQPWKTKSKKVKREESDESEGGICN